MNGILFRRDFLTAAAGVAAAQPVAADVPVHVPELPLDTQIDACVEKLKDLLGQKYPKADYLRSMYSPMGDSFVITVYALVQTRMVWNGPGLYEITDGPNAGEGIYHIVRHRDEIDQEWTLWGARIHEGYRVAPRLHILPWQVIRKIQGDEA